jgi:hypothetical protein
VIGVGLAGGFDEQVAEIFVKATHAYLNEYNNKMKLYNPIFIGSRFSKDTIQWLVQILAIKTYSLSKI